MQLSEKQVCFHFDFYTLGSSLKLMCIFIATFQFLSIIFRAVAFHLGLGHKVTYRKHDAERNSIFNYDF
jgi:hypothetical protein